MLIHILAKWSVGDNIVANRIISLFPATCPAHFKGVVILSTSKAIGFYLFIYSTQILIEFLLLRFTNSTKIFVYQSGKNEIFPEFSIDTTCFFFSIHSPSGSVVVFRSSQPSLTKRKLPARTQDLGWRPLPSTATHLTLTRTEHTT